MSGAPVAVLGSGAWGTALAVLLARSGLEVRAWMRDEQRARRIAEARTNERALPGVALPPTVRPTASLEEALEGAPLVVGAVSSAATETVARSAATWIEPGATWVSATKGLEASRRRRPSEVVAEAAPRLGRVAVLSGPSFAAEVAAGSPTAVVIACRELEEARRLQGVFSGPTFRAYASDDVVGVELGGAVKNVIAIAAGLVSGLELGHDPIAALVTRGLHEMSRLAVPLGAQPRTLSGLAGLGDLVLTCTGHLSRNRRLGESIARGSALEAALRELGQVAEGVETTRLVESLAEEHGVEVPITRAVSGVLFDGLEPEGAVRALMGRDLKDELG